MTQTSPQGKPALSQSGAKLVFAAMNIIYSKEGVGMFKQALENTRSKEAIPATVAMFITTLLHKMSNQIDALPEKEVWGKTGVVHSILNSAFEVAMGLGYKAPLSALEPAYKMVATQYEEVKAGQGGDDEQAEGPQPPSEEQGEPMQGAMPQPDAAQAPPQAMPMQGAMQ